MSENVEQTGCPSFDSISAYLDGEAEGGDARHIESCPNCLKVLSSLRSLDGIVSRSCQPPEGLSTRIMAACAASQGKVVPFPGRSFLRYAAALVITAGLALAVKHAVGPAGPSAPGAELAVAAGPQGTTMGTLSGSPIGSDNLRAVATQPGSSVPVVEVPVVKRFVAPEVSHVWGVKDLGKIEAQLSSQVPEGAKWSLSHDNHGLSVQVSLTDEQLQKLVDSIHGQGYDLFSADLPQPNQAERVKFMGASKKVIYQARFVNITAQ